MVKRKVWGPGEGTEGVPIPGGKGPGKPEAVPGKYNLCVAEVTSLFTNSILAFQPQNRKIYLRGKFQVRESMSWKTGNYAVNGMADRRTEQSIRM